ncbi:hypothetical protein EG349_05110 [Chryseobacterium shandongense]|uniref:Uncharacterized protein n=1 Tax=Chryseobacterium shandongense TaxID=1493872 RepID=A0AAD1DL50_9FLAO|nr:hypothetical protein EG349_05110 [Chryseobacterium shandongense]AZA94618.1 hypothetical protein EG353_03135 [Chryseobacterium shandongense]
MTKFYFFEAFSRYPLYLFYYGLRFAPAATKKDAVSIGANGKHHNNYYFSKLESSVKFKS